MISGPNGDTHILIHTHISAQIKATYQIGLWNKQNCLFLSYTDYIFCVSLNITEYNLDELKDRFTRLTKKYIFLLASTGV